MYEDPTEENANLSAIIEEDNGIVHYYDEEGVEVETFIPGWGC